MKHRSRAVGWLAVIFGLAMLVLLLLAMPSPAAKKQVYGVTFSVPHARGIGLDWQRAYDDILTELGVKQLRLVAYWNEIAPTPDTYDFTDLDYQMDQAAIHNAEVVLAIGHKVPRWPECHASAWVLNLPAVSQEQRLLDMLAVVVQRYQHHPALKIWQLENEPLLDFGICPPENQTLLAMEQVLVRSFDTSHPILITDSGELNSWIPASRYGDVLGTTMYRTVFSARTQKPFKYDYLFPAWLYRAKARLVKLINNKEVLISELQGEPWGATSFVEMTTQDRRASLSPKRLVQLQQFAARTQLPAAYWWGVEYWYWEKEVNNEPIFWETAKQFF